MISKENNTAIQESIFPSWEEFSRSPENRYRILREKYDKLNETARNIRRAQSKANLNACMVINIIIVLLVAELQAIGVSANTTYSILLCISIVVSSVVIYNIKENSYVLSVLEDIDKKESVIREKNSVIAKTKNQRHAYRLVGLSLFIGYIAIKGTSKN